MKEMKKYFLKDISLNNIDDDQFRYQDFANNLRKIIECNEAPFNVAIIGKWGLGKSSLVNMALAPLRKIEKEFLVCDINAWKYEKDEIGKAFIKELWEKICDRQVLSFSFFHKEYSRIVEEMLDDEKSVVGKKLNLKKFFIFVAVTILVSMIIFAIYCGFSNNFYGIEFKGKFFWISTILRYCKNIGSILIIPLVVWLGKLFMDKLNETSYKNYEISFPLETQADYEIYLNNLLQTYYKDNPNKKIVVVIDDLDRLSADKIVEALDALKLFMEYDRFIFIVPFDDEILKNALKSKRIKGISSFDNDYDGEMVLDKIFQYKMYLPQLIKYDMRNYAFNICKNDCSDFIREYCNDDYKLFEEIVGKILIHSNVSTPRQVKKIINTFIENVMISRDREQANKVGEGFATEKEGLQTIAKISVLQSDFNEFYDKLFHDVNAIVDILEVHRKNGELTPNDLLKNYFDDDNILKKMYEPLVNYLIFTETLGHSNITPYLYMSQSETGVLVGDSKQQDFMAAIESCNLVTSKLLISESPVLCSLFVEQLKYNESQMMGNIILSAIECYDAILENDKRDLAVAIAERIPTLFNSLSDFRYELLNETNLILICHEANSKEHNTLVECALSKNQQDLNYSNRVILINKISKIRHELSDITLSKFESYTKEWLVSDESGVQEIISYTEEQGIEYMARTYGQEYVQKIAKHITDNDDFDDKLIDQFGSIITEYLNSNSITEIIDDLMPCYDYPAMYKTLDESINKNQYRELQNAEDIAKKIVCVGVGKLKGIYAYNILSKLSYRIENDEGETFDDFFKDTVTEDEFVDMIEAFAINNNVELLSNTIELLSNVSLEKEAYASDIRRLLKVFGNGQAESFWKKLEERCKYSADNEYEIITDLINELSTESHYDEKMIKIIENIIISQIGSNYNKNNYFSFSIQAIGVYKNKIQQGSIDAYSKVLLKAMSIETGIAINAYRAINKLISDSVWCENIKTILDYISKGTYVVIYDIIIERRVLFNKENGNLSELSSFLIDNINYSDDPDDVINQLSAHFSTISKLDKLISQLMDIEYGEDNTSAKLAKFIDAKSTQEILKIVIDEWDLDDIRKDKLKRILLKSEKYSSGELLNRINENKEEMNKNDLLSILKFCEGDVAEINIKSLTDIFIFLLENYLEKDVCTQILLLISNIPEKLIKKDRERICMILVDIFRESSSDTNRRKSSILIKDKGFARKMRGILNEEELNEYKAYLS